MNDELSLTGTRQILEGGSEAFAAHFLHLFGILNLGLPFLLFLLWGATILYPLGRWAYVISKGQPENRFDRIPERIQRALFEGIGQGRVVREPLGINHQVLFVSFIILFLGTMLVTVQFDTPDPAQLLVVAHTPDGLELLHQSQSPWDKGALGTGNGDYVVKAAAFHILVATSDTAFDGVDELFAASHGTPDPMGELIERVKVLHPDADVVVHPPLPER